jgi:hypothetical protein
MRSEGNSAGGLPALICAAKSTDDKHGSIPTQIEDCGAALGREGAAALRRAADGRGVLRIQGQSRPRPGHAKQLAVEAAGKHGEAELWVQHSDRLARGDGKSADHPAEVFFAIRRQGVRVRSWRTRSAPC